MHRKSAKLIAEQPIFDELEVSRAEGRTKAAFEIRDLKQKLEMKLKETEYHYRFALKLRKNFPLAALNLGALQYVELNQLAEALASFEQCGLQMDPIKAKGFYQHVSTQVECLISASRLLLAASGCSLSAPEICAQNSDCFSESEFEEEGTSEGGLSKSSCGGSSSSSGGFAISERERKEAMTKQTLVREQNDDDVTAVEERFARTSTPVACSSAKEGQLRQTLAQNCATLLKYTDIAKAKANQVVVSWANVVSQEPNKQLATIHWIRAHCNCGIRQQLERERELKVDSPQEDRGRRSNELKLAFEYAKRSQVPIDSSIYISYVDDLLQRQHQKSKSDRNFIAKSSSTNTSPEFGGVVKSGESVEVEEEAEEVLEEAISVERQKLLKRNKLKGVNTNNNDDDIGTSRYKEQIGKLYLRLAKLMAAKSNNNIKQLDQMLALSVHFGATNFNLLSEAAQLSYEWKQFERSEQFYLASLELVRRSELQRAGGPRNGRKLASAHANVGAIVQVRGKLEEALVHYRKALDYDPKNRVAATNLARLERKVAKSRRK